MSKKPTETPEDNIPSKQEVVKFLTEQIEVKKIQLELQVINADLAEARSRELKALGFIAQMTNPTPPTDAVAHNLTQEDMDQNPELADQGFKVGDEVLVPKDSEPAQRKLKK
jgi:transcription antitermination factor NusG